MAAVNMKLNPCGVAILALLVGCSMIYFLGIPKMFRSEETINMKELLAVGIQVAERGGARVKAIHKSKDLSESVKGQTKEGADEKLTEGDLESHRAMMYGFAKAFPSLKVISEEHETKPVDLNLVKDPSKTLNELDFLDTKLIPVKLKDIAVWIDPLDATQEYTEDLLQYVTTMVCVAVNGQPTIGIIHKPFEGENGKTYWGWVGHGHSQNLADKADEPKDESAPKKIIVSRSHSGEVESVAKEAFGAETKVIPAGGAGFKTLEVIEGRADAYVHVTAIKKWDICAGNAIIMSVEGHMTTLKNKIVNYAESGSPVNEDGLLATVKDHESYLTHLSPIFDMLKEGEKPKERKARSVGV